MLIILIQEWSKSFRVTLLYSLQLKTIYSEVRQSISWYAVVLSLQVPGIVSVAFDRRIFAPH